jgi:hypothetical protein
MDGSSTPPHHLFQSYLVAAGSRMIGWYCTLHQLTKKKTNSFARKNYLHILGFPDWFTAAYSSLFFLRLKTCEPFLSMPVFGITVASWIILDSRPAQCAAARNGMILLGWPATVYLCCWVANSAIGIEKALAGLAAPLLKITLIQVHFYFKCPSWSRTGDITQYMKPTYSTF